LLSYLSAFHRDKAEAVQETVVNSEVTLIIVHSVAPEIRGAFGQTLDPAASYLLRRSGEQDWTVVERWPHPPS